MSNKNTVVMTVYNRPTPTFLNTIMGLAKTGLLEHETEVLVVDDGSTTDYETLVNQFAKEGMPIRMIRCNTVGDRPGTYNLDGYNNPAYASNFALEHVTTENVFPMSSDVIAVPAVLAVASRLDLGKVAWMPCVTDMDSGMEYLGPTRIAPYGWFYGVKTEILKDVGWDEEYLKGLAFEDNDVMARLALKVGRLVIDQSVRVWHQSHPQQAYSDDLEGWRRNKKYTIEKWGGIPWENEERSPLAVEITTVNNQIVVDVSRRETVAGVTA